MMNVILMLFLITGSGIAHSQEVVKQECVIQVESKSVGDAGAETLHVRAQFESGALANFFIPKEYWPPEEGKTYRWSSQTCDYCKKWMKYKKGVLRLYSNRQHFTHESEYLRIKTDLAFQSVENAHLREGIRWIPIFTHHCMR